MTRSSPRARAGFRMLAASMAPSALPAPTMVCSSSMNRMTFPARRTSARTWRSFSSNSPRYLVPATMAARSRAHTRRPNRWAGTVPSAMARASPSATAVLPTPGSPSRTGLFLLRRDRIWMTRSSSASRPITGSSCPWAAMAVRSREHWSSCRVSPGRVSGSRGRNLGAVSSPPRAAVTRRYRAGMSTPQPSSTRKAPLSVSPSRPSSRCSALTARWPRRRLSSAAPRMAWQQWGVSPWRGHWAGTPTPTRWTTPARRVFRSAPARRRAWAAGLYSKLASPSSRCSLPT